MLIAINPARQFAQARNSQRESNVNTILNAVGQHLADNKGVGLNNSNCAGLSTGSAIPVDPTPAVQIGSGGSSQVNLSCLISTYIPTALPVDPDGGAAANTLYTIQASSTGRYTICAPKHDEAGVLNAGNYCLTR